MFCYLKDHRRIRIGSGRIRTRPDRLQADKAYSWKSIRAHLRARGITAATPEPADQAGHRRPRGSRCGRTLAVDRQDDKGRNVIERSFNLFKQWRGLATRCALLALTYRGEAVLRAITIWLKALLGDVLLFGCGAAHDGIARSRRGDVSDLIRSWVSRVRGQAIH
jgi:transposase